jgi:DSF synthase
MSSVTSITHNIDPLRAILSTPTRAIRLDWNEHSKALRIGMRVQPIQCYSLSALKELKAVLDGIAATPGVVRTLVLSSDIPRVFNFGGDLALFVLLTRARDVDSLKMYGRMCIDLIWWLENADEYGVFTVGLIQGDCLGGGFESVLPMHRIVCERSANAGFPEILFNLFPGMGAWHFVTRRASVACANELILSGKLYSAQELHARGLVDVIAEDHEGEAAVEHVIQSIEPLRRGTLAAIKARRTIAPVSHQSLLDIVDQWAYAALDLTDRDMRLMERLARAQIRKVGGAATGAIEEIKRIELEQARQPQPIAAIA